MITYRGVRFGGKCVVTRDGKKLNPRLDLFNHSPTGFEWGYGGSGPSQLALAILADFLRDDELAVRLHHPFKRDMIANRTHRGWSITSSDIRRWLTDHKAEIDEIHGRFRPRTALE